LRTGTEKFSRAFFVSIIVVRCKDRQMLIKEAQKLSRFPFSVPVLNDPPARVNARR